MSRNSQNSVKETRVAYPPRSMHISVGQQNVKRSPFKSTHTLGLGVNEQTGRLQWCPGMTCCKFLILLPVVMLPITLVLILLLRMDGMLMALRLQQRQQHQQEVRLLHEQPTYIDDYDTAGGDPLDDIVSEQLLLPYEPHALTASEAERIKRCINFKFGLSETIDVEDRDIMKDARTSFLPRDTTAIPRECLETLHFGGGRFSNAADDYDGAEDYYRRRLRRTTSGNTFNSYYDRVNSTLGMLAQIDAAAVNVGAGAAAVAETHDDTNSESDSGFDSFESVSAEEVDANIAEQTSSLASFWNEHGTKENIRQTQAKTMLKYMDTTVNPCTDFYKYSCGNWEKLHPIPRDKAGYDTFEMLRENLDTVLKQLLESPETITTKPHLTKIIQNIQDLQNNNFDPKEDPNGADIVRSTVNTAAAATAAESAVPTVPEAAEAPKASQELLKEKTARLRRHIVRRRNVLSRILFRYKRQTTTNTKRKRLVATPPAAAASNVAQKKATTPIVRQNAQLKAKHLYQSCINSNLLQKRGIQPLLKLIDDLGGWPVLNAHWSEQNFDWLNLTARLRRYNNDILIVEWVGPDIKNSDENVIQFDQTSLGLPTREYFLQEINSKYLLAYQRFMSEVMHKLGAPPIVAQTTADELIAFETQLASITAPAEQRLNVTKLYKRMTLKQLHTVVPQINWQRYLSILQDRNVQDSEQVVIYAVDYMQDLVALLDQTKKRTVSNYLLWRFVRHRINNVDDRFEDIKQNFYHTLFGREESPSRWKVCIAQVNTNMGMALGSMFVSKYFDENSKRDTLKMTHELQQAFREILKTTDWLDPNTKHLAELKVNSMSLKIGYPDFILNPVDLDDKYAGIEIDPDKYFENTLNVLLHTAKTEQVKLHESVNKTTWQTAPAIVNAYYSRNKNQIMFPAGILQPPFYHRHFPRSLNFGGIGVVIGHELTHGFDDKGRLFDRNGSIHKWWTDSSIRGFDERARCIIAQYSNYTVTEVGIALNGESTQGENIADNGGLRQAFHAYKRWLKDNPHAAEGERLPGINMTGEQLFFLNFGQVWCGAMRPEAVRNKLNTAIHSPGRFRVIGTVSNSQDFAKEFNCPVGSPMNPQLKCNVW